MILIINFKLYIAERKKNSYLNDYAKNVLIFKKM